MDLTLKTLVKALAEKLVAKNRKLATAESCTGGWLAEVATDLPGSSAWFDRAYITYSNAAKQEMLGVSAEQLLRHGAVSEEIVREMVLGVLEKSPVDVAVAISGIAGPGGAVDGKPVGTVWFAWACRDEIPNAECHRFFGNREQVRRQAVQVALKGLIRLTE